METPTFRSRSLRDALCRITELFMEIDKAHDGAEVTINHHHDVFPVYALGSGHIPVASRRVPFESFNILVDYSKTREDNDC